MLSALSSAAEMIADSPSAMYGQARTPDCGLNGAGAAEVLQGLLMGGGAMDDGPGGDAPVEGVSRKDKSLGLLCDNFLQLFASGQATSVELESVASALGVGRRRIYDIVNVLESLDVVHKDRTSAYTWLGISKLPTCIDALTGTKPLVDLLTDDPADAATDKENSTGGTGGAADSATASGSAGGTGAAEGGTGAGTSAAAAAAAAAADKLEGRKEKSIRELSTKFVGLFLQAVNLSSLNGTISLEQAARSLLMHENGTVPGGPEPDPGAMKTKVRRLYDICNVLTSLRMIEKIKLSGTSKPAFKWLGITAETESIFDAKDASNRAVKAYGGGINAPVCAKRKSLGGGAPGASNPAPQQHHDGRRVAAKTAAGAAVAAPAAVAASFFAAAPAVAAHAFATALAPAPTGACALALAHAPAPSMPASVVVNAVPFVPNRAGAPTAAPTAATCLAAPVPATAIPCATSAQHHQTAATVISHSATAPTHEAILRAQAAHRRSFGETGGTAAVQASVVCGAPAASAATYALQPHLGNHLAQFGAPLNSPMLAPKKGQSHLLSVSKGGVLPAPTPAHVQAELLAKGIGLDNTPRAATAALLTMASSLDPMLDTFQPVAAPLRIESNEV